MAYTTTYNKLDLYRKILNLRNINEIVSMLDHQEYLDFDYDKWLYSSDIKEHYLSEKSVAKNVSRELELLFIKERYSIMYDMYYSFFDNRKNLVSSEYTLTHGDVVYISGLINEDDIGFYSVSITTGPLVITLKSVSGANVELQDLAGTFTITKDDYSWIGTSITYNNPDTTIIILDNNLVSQEYLYEYETDDDRETRIASTTEYRKLFLKFVPLLEVFKGTKMYIEFVLKFYHLIKYYDITLSSSQNIAISETASEVKIEYPQKINFVYYIISSIPKSDWDTLIKQCVHPHGWIDTYYETLYSTDEFHQKEFNSMENKPTYSDIILSNNTEILKNVSTIKRYGNIETEDDVVSRGVTVGVCDISGGFSSYEFDYYDTGNQKVTKTIANYTLSPPQFSYEGNDGADTTIKCLFTVDTIPSADYRIENWFSYYSPNHSNPLLEDNPTTTNVLADIYDVTNDVVYYSSLMVIPNNTIDIANPNNYTHLWIQTVVVDETQNFIPVAKSDIISFEIIGDGTRVPVPFAPQPITPPLPPLQK